MTLLTDSASSTRGELINKRLSTVDVRTSSLAGIRSVELNLKRRKVLINETTSAISAGRILQISLTGKKQALTAGMIFIEHAHLKIICHRISRAALLNYFLVNRITLTRWSSSRHQFAFSSGSNLGPFTYDHLKCL